MGLGVEDGDANGIGNVGVGSMGVDGVGGIGVDGMVCTRVTSGRPCAWEVAFPRASGTTFCSGIRTSSSCDSGHVLVNTGKDSCCCRTC